MGKPTHQTPILSVGRFVASSKGHHESQSILALDYHTHMNLMAGHQCPEQIRASLMIGFVVVSG
jgi:hypothetical protein